MKHWLRGAAVAAVVMCGALGTARAAMIVGPLDGVTGINGLSVDGSTYDVVFDYRSFSDVYPDLSASPFYLSRNEALDAAAAVVTVLNLQGVTQIGLISSNGVDQFDIPFYRGTTNIYNFADGYFDQSNGLFVFDPYAELASGDAVADNVAVFTLTSVPLPHSLPLFAGALMLLASWPRREAGLRSSRDGAHQAS